MSTDTMTKPESLSRFVAALQARSSVASDTRDEDERFGRTLARRLGEHLGNDLSGKANFVLESATRSEVGAWKAEQAGGTILVCYGKPDADGPTPVFAAIDKQPMRALATVLLGGRPSERADDSGKPLTRIENSICDMFCGDMAIGLSSLLKTPVAVPPVIGGRDEVDLAPIKSRRVLAIRLRIIAGGQDGVLDIALPEDAIWREPAPKSDTAGQSAGADKAPQPAALGNALSALAVEVSARIAIGSLTYRQVAALKPGEVIPVPDTAFAACTVLAGEQEVARAKVGRSKKRYCIRIG